MVDVCVIFQKFVLEWFLRERMYREDWTLIFHFILWWRQHDSCSLMKHWCKCKVTWRKMGHCNIHISLPFCIIVIGIIAHLLLYTLSLFSVILFHIFIFPTWSSFADCTSVLLFWHSITNRIRWRRSENVIPYPSDCVIYVHMGN